MVMSKRLQGRLKKMFNRTGWSLAELARRSGVDRPTCSKLLSGDEAKKDVETETLERLAKAFGCTVELMTKK